MYKVTDERIWTDYALKDALYLSTLQITNAIHEAKTSKQVCYPNGITMAGVDVLWESEGRVTYADFDPVICRWESQ